MSNKTKPNPLLRSDILSNGVGNTVYSLLPSFGTKPVNAFLFLFFFNYLSLVYCLYECINTKNMKRKQKRKPESNDCKMIE